MEPALLALSTACQKAVAELESIQHDNSVVPFARFDQKTWRTRLGKVRSRAWS